MSQQKLASPPPSTPTDGGDLKGEEGWLRHLTPTVGGGPLPLIHMYISGAASIYFNGTT
jgi:hypothetical protein